MAPPNRIERMKVNLIIIPLLLFGLAECAHKPCQLRVYPSGFVCVCNETYCDTTDVEKPKQFGEFVMVSSTKGGQRFAVSQGKFQPKIQPEVFRVERDATEPEAEIHDFKDEPSYVTIGINTITFKVNRNSQYQKIVGFGGAFTGTVSYLFDLMPDTLRHALYRNYYSQDEGIGYSMMRIPIGGCDFDFEPWVHTIYSFQLEFFINVSKFQIGVQ